VDPPLVYELIRLD